MTASASLKVSVPFVSRRVVLATGNPGKLREMRAILAGHGLEVVAQSAARHRAAGRGRRQFRCERADQGAACGSRSRPAGDRRRFRPRGGRPRRPARASTPRATQAGSRRRGEQRQAARGARRRAGTASAARATAARWCSCAEPAIPTRSSRKRLGGQHRFRAPRAGRLRLRPALHRRRRGRSPRRRCPKRTRTASATAARRWRRWRRR